MGRAQLLTLLPMTALTAGEERVLRAPGSASHGVQHIKEIKIMEDLERQDSETPPGPRVSRGPKQRPVCYACVSRGRGSCLQAPL